MQRAPEPDPLLAEVEEFLVRYGVTATGFGMQALGDPGFVHDLRGGREPRRATVARVRRYMAQQAEAV